MSWMAWAVIAVFGISLLFELAVIVAWKIEDKKIIREIRKRQGHNWERR